MNRNAKTLWTIVLAAGGSSRLGEPKQLLRVGGRPLIARAVRLAQALTPKRVVVVVGAQQLRMRTLLRHLEPAPRIVTNGRWQSGMSSSLRRGIATLPPRATAALVLTVDQPHIGRRELRRLVATWSQAPQRATAASYAGRLGVPAILPRRLWRLCRRATGDIGARAVLRNEDIRVTGVDLPSAAIDIDTQADVARLTQRP